jgi:quercetin dioxygenase-like cupin family protein
LQAGASGACGQQGKPNLRVGVRDSGLDVLEQAVIECAPGTSLSRATDEAEEVLFVVAGAGELALAGARHPLEPETGAYLAPGEEYELHNQGSEPMRVVSVRIPDPVAPDASGASERAVVRRLADQEAQDATTARTFRIVADPSTGLRSATHFVGYVPTERAPEHFHTYDEVIYILEGEGALHTESSRTPVVAGSVIELPARTVHCLENTGEDTMRLVAVFRPAGSPAAAYYRDGTPAYPGMSPVLSASRTL